MRRTILCLLAAALLVVALPALGQDMGGHVAEVHFVWVKAGMNAQFEAGVKKHMELHKQHNDPSPWLVWQVIAGENTGAYGVGSFNHKWADFDNPGVPADADMADVMANIAPSVEKHVAAYYVMLDKASNPAPEDAPHAMDEVITFHVKYGKGDEFRYAIGKINEAIKKTNWPVHYEWYALWVGGHGGEYVLVLPRANWAAFAPQEKSFDKMLEEALGKQEAEDLIKKFDHIVKYEESEVIRERPDLSYMPKSGM